LFCILVINKEYFFDLLKPMKKTIKPPTKQAVPTMQRTQKTLNSIQCGSSLPALAALNDMNKKRIEMAIKIEPIAVEHRPPFLALFAR
jgi:hypothetical protein